MCDGGGKTLEEKGEELLCHLQEYGGQLNGVVYRMKRSGPRTEL